MIIGHGYLAKLFSKEFEEKVAQEAKHREKQKLLSVKELREQLSLDEKARCEEIKQLELLFLTRVKNHLQTDLFVEYINEHAKFLTSQEDLSAVVFLHDIFPFKLWTEERVLDKVRELLNENVHPDFEIVKSKYQDFVLKIKNKKGLK